MEEIKIGDRRILSDANYRLEEISLTKPDLDGVRHSQKNEVYFRPDAVAVLLVDKAKREFILARQLRLPVFLNPHGAADGYLLEVCAGLIEDGESPEQAVIREAREETGFEISGPVKMGGVYTSAGGITEYLHLFITEVNGADQSGDGGGAEGEGEYIELVRLAFDEAQQSLAAAKINDAKTMLLLQHYFYLMQ
jgi:GDP-mannose pyrophosphatase NudK